MTSSTDERRDQSGDARSSTETDGGATVEFDERLLYGVVRKAVKDAILDVVGTLLLLGIAFVGVWTGILALGSSTAVGTALGVAVIAVSLYVAAATLEVVPPVREWF